MKIRCHLYHNWLGADVEKNRMSSFVKDVSSNFKTDIQLSSALLCCNQDCLWVPHRNPEPDLQTSNMAGKTRRKKPGAEPGSYGGNLLLRVGMDEGRGGWKDRKRRETDTSIIHASTLVIQKMRNTN